MSPPPLAVGQELGPIALDPVARLDLITYAGASGDFNPIHTSDEAAAEAGLPGVVQHGMLTMARIGLLFSPYLQSGFLRQFDVRFAQIVRLGDTLRISGRVMAAEDGPDGRAYRCEVSATNQHDQVVASGTATFLRFD